MKPRLFLIPLFLALSLNAFGAEYQVDKAHSNVGFQISHLLSRVQGEFRDFEGTIQFDAKHLEDTKVNATVDASSISTNNEKRDAHLKSEDFFFVQKYPKLTLVSKKVTKSADNKYKMTADLTIRGVTKEVPFDIELLGMAKDPWGAGQRAGLVATATIDRKDFGMKWNKALDQGGFVLGDKVTINLNVEAAEKAAEAKAADKAPEKKK